MRREIMVAARQIAAQVKSSEDEHDLALAANARLLASLLDARRNAGLPAKTGRAALERLSQAISHGAKARELLLDTHEELARLNLRELAVGDVFECPETGFSADLRLVPSEAQAA